MSSTTAQLLAEPSPHRLSMTPVSTEIKEFAIVPLHAAPSDAVAEIDSLYDVYLDVWQKWDLEVRQPPPPALGSGAPLLPQANQCVSPGRTSY